MSDKSADTELSPYESMISERLETLKKKFDNFPLEEGEDEGTKLPAFIMLHIAQLYTRMDLLLAELDALKSPEITPDEEALLDPEFQKAKADAEADIEKELSSV